MKNRSKKKYTRKNKRYKKKYTKKNIRKKTNLKYVLKGGENGFNGPYYTFWTNGAKPIVEDLEKWSEEAALKLSPQYMTAQAVSGVIDIVNSKKEAVQDVVKTISGPLNELNSLKASASAATGAVSGAASAATGAISGAASAATNAASGAVNEGAAKINNATNALTKGGRRRK